MTAHYHLGFWTESDANYGIHPALFLIEIIVGLALESVSKWGRERIIDT